MLLGSPHVGGHPQKFESPTTNSSPAANPGVPALFELYTWIKTHIEEDIRNEREAQQKAKAAQQEGSGAAGAAKKEKAAPKTAIAAVEEFVDKKVMRDHYNKQVSWSLLGPKLVETSHVSHITLG